MFSMYANRKKSVLMNRYNFVQKHFKHIILIELNHVFLDKFMYDSEVRAITIYVIFSYKANNNKTSGEMF